MSIFTRKQAEYQTSHFLQMRINGTIVRRMETVLAFLRAHSGVRHHVYVVQLKKRQSLVCSCGHAKVGDLSHGTLDVTALVEDDLVDP